MTIELNRSNSRVGCESNSNLRGCAGGKILGEGNTMPTIAQIAPERKVDTGGIFCGRLTIGGLR